MKLNINSNSNSHRHGNRNSVRGNNIYSNHHWHHVLRFLPRAQGPKVLGCRQCRLEGPHFLVALAKDVM